MPYDRFIPAVEGCEVMPVMTDLSIRDKYIVPEGFY